MTAEEKLKELYKEIELLRTETKKVVDHDYGSYMHPEHIDLIANLVIERMENGNHTEHNR